MHNLDCVRELLSRGANPNLLGPRQFSPLLCAIAG